MIFLFKLFKEARLKKGEFLNNALPTEGAVIKLTYKPIETEGKKVEKNCRLQNKYGSISVSAGEYVIKGVDGQYITLSETDVDTLFEKQQPVVINNEPPPSIEPQPQPTPPQAQSQPAAQSETQPNPQSQPESQQV